MTVIANSSKKHQKRQKLRDKEATRAEILQSALYLFSSKGFDGVSIRNIAEYSNLNHTLVNYYFGSKLDLWYAVVDEVFSDYQQRLNNRIQGLDNMGPEIVLKLMIREFVVFCAERPELQRIVMIESVHKSERLDWLYDQYLRKMFRAAKKLIQACQKIGVAREGDAGRLFYSMIGVAGSHFSFLSGYKEVTGSRLKLEDEIENTIEIVHTIFFY